MQNWDVLVGWVGEKAMLGGKLSSTYEAKKAFSRPHHYTLLIPAYVEEWKKLIVALATLLGLLLLPSPLYSISL